MHFLLPIPNKRDSDWKYSWVPILGPALGATSAAVMFSYSNSYSRGVNIS